MKIGKVIYYLILLLLLLLGVHVLTTSAKSAPPKGAVLESKIAKWFEAQKDDKGNGCCSVSDGHRVPLRRAQTPDREWDFFWKGKWQPVPVYNIYGGKTYIYTENPLQEGVVFFLEWLGGITVYCVRPAIST